MALLSKSPNIRLRDIVCRKTNKDRPRLSDEAEERLRDLDERSAACYAELEDLSERFAFLAGTINGEFDDCVPEAIESTAEKSLAVHIERARTSVHKRKLDAEPLYPIDLDTEVE